MQIYNNVEYQQYTDDQCTANIYNASLHFHKVNKKMMAYVVGRVVQCSITTDIKRDYRTSRRERRDVDVTFLRSSLGATRSALSLGAFS